MGMVSAGGRRSFADTVASWFDTGAPGRFVPTFRDWQTSGALWADATTPAVLEQAVWMSLDRARSLRRGPEMITNGDFSAGTTGWSIAGSGSPNWVIAGGVATAAPLASSSRYVIWNAGGMVAGRVYDVAFDVVTTNGVGGVRMINNTDNGTPYAMSTGRFSAKFIAGGVNAAQIWFQAGANWGGSITNISIKEIPGAHRIQPTSQSRPILTARKNRLLMTADLSNAAWTKRGAAASAPAVGPDGVAASASLLTNIGAAAANDIYQLIAGEPASITMAPGVAIKKVTTTGSIQINNAQNQANGRWTVDLALLGADWETLTPTHPAVTVAAAWSSTAAGSAGMQFSSLGGITASFYVGGIGLMRGTYAGRYQRVNTATDYDAVGFPVGLRYDGIDDCMYTAAPIDYSGTNKVTSLIPHRKDNDSTTVLMEHGPTAASTVGTFAHLIGPQFGWRTMGTVSGVLNSLTAYPAPASTVLGGTVDIAAPSNTIRVNGVVENTTPSDRGTGNFTSQVNNEGARNNASLRLNGVVYGELQIGNLRTADELAYVESEFGKLLLEA